MYCNYWSDSHTWGGEFAPITGDLVYIPAGLQLLVDVDSTPVLSAVLVEGSLIFPPHSDPNHIRTFDAHYVLITGGYLEAGTELFPYTSKLIITMHSDKYSPELPIYGNKVIAMYNGIIDMHGMPRTPTWTMLNFTANMGDITITLIEAVDWKVGEQIIIAPTGYYNTEAEQMTIVAIDRTNANNPVITLDQPLQYKHYSAIEYYGDDFIEMRAEVGLLTRNILYRGDPETSARNQYGAHIMVHADGQESLIARIEYVEFFDCGQAFQLGRYPIHFHLIGAVHNSYIQGNAIHQSYNRATTIHGVLFLRVINNVAYNTMGHAFFIEDAVETKNLIQHNLAILTRRSWSLLNSDQTPASFWITHPDNMILDNHAAGSDDYGFWFDTKPNPTGPSYDPNICPENDALGQFTNNVAHSNGRYGLRLFHKLKSRMYPCQNFIYDPNNKTDHYWQNPVITNIFENFTSYKNIFNGAIALDMADVRWYNFKVADNLLAGLEFELTSELQLGNYSQINGALVIGRSGNADNITNFTNSRGIITPRTENFQVHNVKFYNFDVFGKAAFGSCSHCFAAPSTDSGARTTSFSGIYYDSSVTKRISYQEPWRDIFYDIDGSLTGQGPGSWASPYFLHNVQPECSVNLDVYNGLLCNSSVQMRRIVFYNFAPSIVGGLDLKILRIDDSILSQMSNTSLTNYWSNTSNFSPVGFRPRTNPASSWAFPIVTGHKYHFHWGTGTDWTQMELDTSPHWKSSDLPIQMAINFTDIRASYDIVSNGYYSQNGSYLNASAAAQQTGANVLFNDTATRLLYLLISGSNNTKNQTLMTAHRCVGPCLPPVTTVAISSTVLLWSDPASWNSTIVPQAGDDITIPPGMNFLYDLPESPIYNYVQINGRVTFKQDAPKLHLNAMYIFVRSGELLIGNKTNPYLGDAKITLYGDKQSESIVYTDAIEAGNKILANTALMSMWGAPRIHQTRLLKTVQPNDTQIIVPAGLGWNTNDTIVLAPTTINWFEIDQAIIASYDNVTGIVKLQQPLTYYHYGEAQTTASRYSGVDIRGEVALLTRNIKITANVTDGWGCQVLTGDFVEGDGTYRSGHTLLDNVEIHNCSQYDTLKAALRFESSVIQYSQISNCAIHDGLGQGVEINYAANLSLVNNTIFGFKDFGVSVDYSTNITLDGNWGFAITSRHLLAVTFGDPTAVFSMCAQGGGQDLCYQIKFINNIAAGTEATRVDSTGFSVYPHECNDYDTIVFKNNVAHSTGGTGAIVYINRTSYAQSQCMEASYFAAYKCPTAGIVANSATDSIVFSNMVLIDNGFSAIAQIGKEGDVQFSIIKDSFFYGESEAKDCPAPNYCGVTWGYECFDKVAIMASCFSAFKQPGLVSIWTDMPQYEVKDDMSIGGYTQYSNNSFINFNSSTTYCGMSQRLFELNPYGPDYYPIMHVPNAKLINVDFQTLAYLYTPPHEWASIDNCGEFPCTGPNNVLIRFEQATYGGAIQPLTPSNFQIISGNAPNSGAFQNCKRVDAWNGYYCQNDQLAMLTFESQDSDWMSRIVTPITITGLNNSAVNVLNTFEDHNWDGFYTSMRRMSRFPAVLEGGNDMYYQINYTGTPPMNQIFTLRSNWTSVVIRIQYPQTGAYVVFDTNGVLIQANKWDDTLQAPGLIKGAHGGYCGENRYVGVSNILEFYLAPGCNISVNITDSIQAKVRLNWTLSSFYSSGGTTKFVDRIAASLGIKVQQVKIVSVYEGSVVVNFAVQPDITTASSSSSSTSSSGASTIQSLQTQLTNQLKSNQIDLGAPILNVDVTTVQASDIAASINKPSPIVSSTGTTTTGLNTNPNQQNTGTQVQTPLPPKVAPITPGQSITIYNNNTVLTVQTQGGDSGSGSTMMIAVICSIIGVIVFGGGIAYVVYRKYSRISSPTHVQAGNMPVDQSSKISEGSPNPHFEEAYEDQYHPRADFDIFASGDPLAKANKADPVIEEEDEYESNSPDKQVLTDGEGDLNRFTRARDSQVDEQARINPREGALSQRFKPDEEEGRREVTFNE